MREKLIKLLKNSLRESGEYCGENTCQKCQYDKYGDDCGYAIRADYFIANGVTFAEDNNVPSKWIPVTEPPKENGYYLCVLCVSSVNQRKEYRRMILFWEDNVWIDMANCFRTKKPLYWTPLPEPPKGE